MANVNISSIEYSKVLLHPERVAEWKRTGDCYPIYVEIGLTNTCNHNCLFCALDYLKRERDFIDKEIMVSTLKDMGGVGVKSIMFAGEGESTLHKNIGLFTRVAKDSGMDVSITTNGIPFGGRKLRECLPNLSWIRFSIDSGSPENYALIHGTKPSDFGRLLKNISHSVDFKREYNLDLVIGTQFLMISESFRESEKLAKILSATGVDNLQIKPYSHHPLSNNNFVVNKEEYNRLEDQLNQYNTETFKIAFRRSTIQRIQGGLTYPLCYGLPFFALIDSKGNVLPCNLFYGKKEFIYGNLYKNSFPEIWQSNQRKKVLEKLHETGMDNCRRGCRLDPTNRDLHRIKNPRPHDNFL